jgi:hypothetical protein
VLRGERDLSVRIEVYRHGTTRVLLDARRDMLCLVLIEERGGGGGSSCETVAEARRGELQMTLGASSHGVNWVEEYRVIPDGPRSVVIATRDCRRRIPVRHNILQAFIPTPAQITFRLNGRLIHASLPNAGYPLPPEAERTEPFCTRPSSE